MHKLILKINNKNLISSIFFFNFIGKYEGIKSRLWHVKTLNFFDIMKNIFNSTLWIKK